MPAFQAPPDFVVERVAGPPLVRYPLFADLDDRGRLFVAEGTGANLPAEVLRARKLGRITLLEDRDGDGTFDTSRVFADGLVFPQGILWHDGAVYTASHPSLWKLEDPNDTGTATRRTELVTGFGFNGNGCDLHGPFLGPDGRLYWTDGRHGYKVRTPEGETLEGLAARIWRCRTDGREVERLCGGGFDNPVEVAFTPEGELIGTMDQGVGDCLLHYVEGGVYPMEHACLKEFPRTGLLLGAVRQYTPVLPAALCGLTRYRSGVFGATYRDRLFSTHYMLHKVVRHDLIRDGSTFRAEDTDFLTTTAHDVRLTDVLEDADGSLLVVDMGAWFTYGFPGNPLPRPEAFGAIYRVRKPDARPIADPWGKSLKLDQRTAAELVELLGDHRPRVRDQVIARLAGLGGPAVDDLGAALRAGGKGRDEVRREATWALCRIGNPDALSTLQQALSDEDEGVRLAAAHAVGLWRDQAAVSGLARLVGEETPAVRRRAAEALGRIGRPQAVPALLGGLRKGGDLFLEHSLIYAILRINDREVTLPALADPDPKVRRAGLIALDQMKDGRLTRDEVAPLLDADDPALKLAALAVVARRPEWPDLTERVARAWMRSPGLEAAQEKALTDALLALGDQAPIRQLLAEAVTSPELPTDRRVKLLRVMGQARSPGLPAEWVEALRRALTDPDAAVRSEVVAVAKARNVSSLDRELVAFARQAGQPAGLRIAALECVVRRAGSLDEESFALLAEHLSEATEPLLRLAAARTLGASTLSRAELLRLAGSASSASAAVLRPFLPVFARSGDREVGSALADALGHNPSAEVLGTSELDQVLEAYPAGVKERADPLRAKLAARQAGKAAYLARLSAELAPLQGDADAGQELFLSQRLGCYGCHRAVGRGGTVGPDLSRIGRIRTRAELLKSILFPDLAVAPEYRSFLVEMHDGRTATGLIARDGPDAVTLRTADLAEVRIPREDVERLTPAATSLMPEGLEKLLTRQELCDLLEFLCTQR
jgi:putative heme-binding domain-containing protein